MGTPRYLPRDPETALEKLIRGFSEQSAVNREQKQTGDALRDIYAPYQSGPIDYDQAYIQIQQNPKLSPTARVNAIRDLESHRAQESAARKSSIYRDQTTQSIDKDTLLKNGFTPEEAELFPKLGKGGQQTMIRTVDERNQRSRRPEQTNQQPKLGSVPDLQPMQPGGAMAQGAVMATPGEPEQQTVPEKITSQDVLPEDQWPDVADLQPVNMTPKEEVKYVTDNQKADRKKLEELNGRRQAEKTIDVELRRLETLSERIPDDIYRLMIDPETGEPYDKAKMLKLGYSDDVQAYIKTYANFLKNAKEFFPGRVTNFDLETFKRTLPGLTNTQSGRRIILKQMQLMNELSSVHTSEMKNAMQHYNGRVSYAKISEVVDDRVASKEAETIAKIDDLVKAGEYMNRMAANPKKYKNTVLMRSSDGKFEAVPKSRVAEAKQQGWMTY